MSSCSCKCAGSKRETYVHYLKINLHHNEGVTKLPSYANDGDSGMDVCNVEKITVEYGKITVAKCGFSMEIPNGFEIQVRPRSGLALKHGITVVNSPGTIDSGYRGEIAVILTSLKEGTVIDFEPGTKIAQLVLAPIVKAKIEVVKELSSTERGTGGFGSTGL